MLLALLTDLDVPMILLQTGTMQCHDTMVIPSLILQERLRSCAKINKRLKVPTEISHYVLPGAGK